MDKTLDMQVAALIFLAGTKSLVTSADTGDAEMTTEKEADSEEPAPSNNTPLNEYPFSNPNYSPKPINECNL
ncbi:MAG: hypothetical protein ACJZ5D_04200 [Candidatus Thalassarchaeaceae archaeon]|tara:strand:+ start:494 stop:709 length:216 start_codon:yes stop_codon:yes gene_type:complete